jgi:hypothetical protein
VASKEIKHLALSRRCGQNSRQRKVSELRFGKNLGADSLI